MIDLQSMLAAAQGHAPSREVVAAREGLTGAERRAADRAVRRGEAADDPAVARLAVAQARMVMRRGEDSAPPVVAAAMLVALAAVAVWACARGHVAVGLVVAAIAAAGVWLLWHENPPSVALARDAERRNRDALERAGRPYVEDPAGAVRVHVPAAPIVVVAVVVWIFNDLVIGSLRVLLEGGPLTLAEVVQRGALVATFLVVGNFVWRRRRMPRSVAAPDRQTRRPGVTGRRLTRR